MGGFFELWALFVAIVVAVLVLHVAVCLFAGLNPQSVASAIAQPDRTLTAWLYLLSLRVGRNDPEMDLVQSGIPFDALVANCRRRAFMSLALSGVAAVVLVVVVFVAFKPGMTFVGH